MYYVCMFRDTLNYLLFLIVKNKLSQKQYSIAEKVPLTEKISDREKKMFCYRNRCMWKNNNRETFK